MDENTFPGHERAKLCWMAALSPCPRLTAGQRTTFKAAVRDTGIGPDPSPRAVCRVVAVESGRLPITNAAISRLLTA